MTTVEFHARDGIPIKHKSHVASSDDQHSEHMRVTALGQLFCPWRYKGTKYEVKDNAKASANRKIVLWKIFTLVRRLAIFVAAIVYIGVSFRAASETIDLLQAATTPEVDMSFFSSRLIVPWMGNATIRWSPLVLVGLNGSTTPIHETIYLDGAALSRSGCASVPSYMPTVYDNTFLRDIAANLSTQTAYNLTFFKEMELIAPVVDCYWDGIFLSTDTVLRVYYLMRHKNNTDDVALLSFSWSIQDYQIPQQNRQGPAGVANLALIRHMAPTSPVDHYHVAALTYPYAALKFQVYSYLGISSNHELRLLSIPPNRALETPKEVRTSSRTGFYRKVETQQTNFRNAHPITERDPSLVLSRWRFQGGPVMRNTWAWVHYVHVFFALDALLNLAVLFVVAYRNLVRGRIWMGDAFVSISNTLLHRGAIVVITWVVDGGWTLMEFCYLQANDVSGFMKFYNSTTIIHADLLTLFLSFTSLVGYLLRERIDPALAVLLFEIGFSYRVEIASAVPVIKNSMIWFSFVDLILGKMAMEPVYAQSTPMRFWSLHELEGTSPAFICFALLPMFGMVAVVVAYVIVRKIVHRVDPATAHILKVSDYSEKPDELEGLKRTLTLFEVATGAALQSRVGVVSDYDNCIFVKGTKYASADGIYSNGYVIANGKFLLATGDLVAIFVLKSTRIRLKNIYVYEVDGRTVQQTARHLYAHTIPWGDLLRLDIRMLS